MRIKRTQKNKAGAQFESLLAIMERLRRQCPWDKKQTPESIQHYLLEEAYEALEAIHEKDWKSFKEELGDLLFQIVFQSHMASEAKRFELTDVLEGIEKKLIARHPHIFGNARIRTAEEQVLKWEEYKAKENGKSLLDRVPKGMSALLQSYELQDRAHRLGFTWKNVNGVERKFNEELREWKNARKSESKKKMEEELGDLLFTLTNVARWIKLNPEQALLKANLKFRRRIAKLQQILKKQNLTVQDCSERDLEKLWNRVKR